LNHNNFTYNILNEALITNEIVFYFTKNFYLVDEINEKVSNLKSGGFIKFLMLKYLTNLSPSKKIASISSLSMSQLYGVFEILFYGLIIATFVFFVEFTFEIIKKMFKKLFAEIK
jgi:hypothetical protein